MQRAIADAVLSRIRGAEGEAIVSEMASDAGPGWVEPGAAAWVVHSDVAMLVGGIRALLLQSLHPLAMAGVAQHSEYQADPWGRLQRTAAFLARTTFGSAQQAEAACAQVRAVHRRVTGVATDGRTYSASDPHLLEWVHLAEVDSFLAAHQRYGTAPLDARGADEYVASMARVAGELGVVDPPTDVAGLRTRLHAFRPELRRSHESTDAARWLLLTPPLPLAARAPYAVLASAGFGLLPLWAQRMIAVPVAPPLEATVVRPAVRAALGVMRWGLAVAEPGPAQVPTGGHRR